MPIYRTIQNLAAWQRLSVLLIGVFLLRIIYLLVSPLDLISDEAYYWDWSRRLDWCYYSKPPMIAWLNWLSTTSLGATTFAVRLTAAVLGTFGLTFVFLLGRDLFDARVGLLATMLAAFTPGNALQSALMTIDVPFLFFWCGSLWTFWRFVNADKRATAWAIATGLMIGFGILSKQTMLGYLPLAALFLLINPEDRRRLFSWRFGLMSVICLSFLSPIVIWNASHDWITFQHTASHFDENTIGLGTRLSRSAEFIGSQIGAVSPILWLVMVTVFLAAIRYHKSLNRQEQFLLCFSFAPLMGVVALSLKQRLEPNWPAAFYPAAFVLIAACFCRVSEFSQRLNISRWVTKASVVNAAICTTLFYVTSISLPYTSMAGSSIDFTSRLRGWSELAREVEARLPADYARRNTPIIATTGRSFISELAFYLPSQTKISRWTSSQEIHSQYDLWNHYPSEQSSGTNRRSSSETIIITEADKPLNAELAESFQAVEKLGEVTVSLGHNRHRAVHLWLARAKGDDNQAGSFSQLAQTPKQGAVRR